MRNNGRLHSRLMMATATALLLAGCDEPLDLDLRGQFGGVDTSSAARGATTSRPSPDDRGIISYPNYQVAVARRGDTLASLAARIGVDAQELARYNGIQPGDSLRQDEIIALPRRVSEPSPATGAVTTGPIRAPGVDITELAESAIDRSEAPTPDTAEEPQTGIEPIRHKVQRGETAYTIARLYKVSVRALADWNGLGSDFAIREGQFLLIPTPLSQKPDRPDETENGDVTRPGAGSPTPIPPSATKPLPQKDEAPGASEAAAQEDSATPDLSESQTEPEGSGRFAYPLRGKIIREYAKGKNDGIDIGAAPGTSIGAAGNGTVAAITSDADQVPIIVVKHPDNLLTVYANVAGIAVEKGDTVSRGQKLAEVRSGNAAYLHFEVREGFESVDPLPYLQ